LFLFICPIIGVALRGIFLALAVTIFMFSCTSGNNQIIKEQAETEPGQAKEAEPLKSVKRTIALFIKETTLYTDGEVDVYSIYVYSKNSDQLIEKELYNSQDELIERESFSYENKLQRQVKYGYDNQGSIIRIEHIDGSGRLKKIIKQEYLYRE